MPKKIMIVVPAPSSYLQGLLRATKYLGIDTQIFASRTFTLSEKIIAGVFNRREMASRSLNHRLVIAARKFRPNIVLVMKGENISSETLNEIKEFGIRTVNWFPDYINAFELAKKLANIYDYFFHFDPLAVKNLKKLNLRAKIFCLPFCSDILPNDPKPLSNKYKYKVTFVGNYYPIREEYLKSIADLGLNIWGDKRWANSVVANCYRGGQLQNYKFVEVARASKINVNIQHEYPCEGIVLRPFEVIGAGAFLLTHNKKDVRRLFKNNVAIFSSPKDLRRKVLYYLGHHIEREQFTNKGYSIVKAKHTYIHRIREILSYN